MLETKNLTTSQLTSAATSCATRSFSADELYNGGKIKSVKSPHASTAIKASPSSYSNGRGKSFEHSSPATKRETLTTSTSLLNKHETPKQSSTHERSGRGRDTIIQPSRHHHHHREREKGVLTMTLSDLLFLDLTSRTNSQM
ncbi:hypothetical protein C2S51_010277 [Perilla frutescens var. frutescens]|nr:hypothetical protein C2S51_010277 [Perilla frutescens var. frutescens]